MHGIIGQLATDPVRLAIGILTAIAVIAIVRCLSGLAFFHGPPPTQLSGPRQTRSSERPDDNRAARPTTTHIHSSAQETE